jgi:predicted porin
MGMKKVLLGTTALLAAGMLSSQAMAGEPMSSSNLDLTLGGSATFKLEMKSKNPQKSVAAGTSYRNHNFEFDSELEFKGDTTLENGVEIGFEIELEAGGAELQDLQQTAEGGDIIDENYIWLDGAYGKIYMGGRDDEELEVDRPSLWPDVGLMEPDAGSHELANLDGGRADSIDSTGQDNKISWLLPAIGGLDIAINYTPDDSEENSTDNVQDEDDDAGGKDKVLHIATKWSGAFGGADVEISASYETGRAEDPTADDDIDDDNRLRFGFEVALDDITIGGYWRNLDDGAVATTPSESRTDWGIGVTYAFGDWEIGGAYDYAKQEELSAGSPNTKDGDDEATSWEVGATYVLNDDMDLEFGYREIKFEDEADLNTSENTGKSIDVEYKWDVGDGLEFDVGYQHLRYTHHSGLSTSESRTANALVASVKVSF